MGANGTARAWGIRAAFTASGVGATLALAGLRAAPWGAGDTALFVAMFGFGAVLAVALTLAWLGVRPRVRPRASPVRGVIAGAAIAAGAPVAIFVALLVMAGAVTVAGDGILSLQIGLGAGAAFGAFVLAACGLLLTRTVAPLPLLAALAWSFAWPWSWLALRDAGDTPLMLFSAPLLGLWLVPMAALAGEWVARTETKTGSLAAPRRSFATP